jgi:hypothetical protein
MAAFDSVFWRSPWTPVQVDFGTQTQQVLGSVSAPLILATAGGCPELWVNIGIVTDIVLTDSFGNSQTFSDFGWGSQPLIQLRDITSALVRTDPTGGGANRVYFTPASETIDAILATLAAPCSGGGSERKLCTAFSRVLSAA